MSTASSQHRADLSRPRAPAPSRLERAYGLYRRRIARCRTENQINRVHIALENYITPTEVRYLFAALADDPADSPSRRWVDHLRYFMLNETARPVEFERRGVLRSATHYTADVGSREQKTLILGFAGKANRLMLPMQGWLDCLDPALYDLLVLRDFTGKFFAGGVPGIGGNFFEMLSNLPRQFDLGSYRDTIAVGTSAGALPALLAAIRLKLARGIAIGGMDFAEFAAKLRTYGVSEASYAALFASRPDPFPELFLVYCGDYAKDAAAAKALHQRVPSRLWPVTDCAGHAVLKWQVAQRRLPVLLSSLLGQSARRVETVGSQND